MWPHYRVRPDLTKGPGMVKMWPHQRRARHGQNVTSLKSQTWSKCDQRAKHGQSVTSPKSQTCLECDLTWSKCDLTWHQRIRCRWPHQGARPEVWQAVTSGWTISLFMAFVFVGMVYACLFICIFWLDGCVQWVAACVYFVRYIYWHSVMNTTRIHDSGCWHRL